MVSGQYRYESFCSAACLRKHVYDKTEGPLIKVDAKTARATSGLLAAERVARAQVLDAERRASIDLEIEVLRAAAGIRIGETILAARAAGKYGPYSWLKETKLRQVMRAAAHLNIYLQKKFGELPDDGEDDLAHAITRLAFVGAMDDRSPKNGG